MIRNVTIGTDVELFVQERETGRIVSAEGYAKGTKTKPFVFDRSNKFFATSLDNVAFEFCIPPARTVEEFVKHIQKSVAFVNSQLPPHLCSVAQASALIPPEFLQTVNAQTFGCEPDFNAWTRDVNTPPDAGETNLRSTGFHVHVGFENPTMEMTERIVRTLDLYLGIPSLILDPDKQRRLLYGKAGAFRPKPYGFEYRTLSGYFAANDRLVSWVYENTQRAIDYVNNDGELDEQFQYVIDMNQGEKAQEIVKKYNIPLP